MLALSNTNAIQHYCKAVLTLNNVHINGIWGKVRPKILLGKGDNRMKQRNFFFGGGQRGKQDDKIFLPKSVPRAVSF